jgi:uncharacterized protein YqgV (UPF0045/DUF77 family)
MGTCIEGEWDEVIDTIKKCFEALNTLVGMMARIDFLHVFNPIDKKV